ncbi:MAG: hypothetical protein CME16_03020, partial [Gemmatimonadetes bacterium]|nr:hypothetical protein [Gemmatimonadota bacterium]
MAAAGIAIASERLDAEVGEADPVFTLSRAVVALDADLVVAWRRQFARCGGLEPVLACGAILSLPGIGGNDQPQAYTL